MLVWDGILWTPYEGRKIRFAIDYKSLPFEPKISSSMESRFGFVNNKVLKRMSIVVDPKKTFRSQFTTKLKTDDPISDIFYNDFLEANKTVFFTGDMLKPFLSYYAFDDNGMDIPLVPSFDDIKTSTGINSLNQTLNGLFIPLAIGLGIYFGYPFLKKGKVKK